MKHILMLMFLALMLSLNDYVYSQSEDDLSKEVICPCMLEYGFNTDVKESLNTGTDFHPVLKFIGAEIKDGVVICKYDSVFYSLKNSSAFEFLSHGNLEDNWRSEDSVVIKYYSSQSFHASVINYIYGDISAAQFGENFKSVSLSDPSSANVSLKSGGSIKLNESKNGFLIKRNDIIKMKALTPGIRVPTSLGKKKNNTAPDNLQKK